IPYTRLHAHFISSTNNSLLTTVPYRICGLNIRPLIHRATIYFHPRVRLERYLLRSQHHPRVHSMLAQQIGCDEGALETEDLPRIPDTGVVDGVTYAVERDLCSPVLVRHFPPPDHGVNRLEGATC